MASTITDLSSETLRFSDIQYQRPEMDDIKSRFGDLLDAFKIARNAKEQNEVIIEINKTCM